MTSTQEQFLRDTQWLRPWTRRAASFSIRTAGWLPGVIRNAPLNLVKKLLQRYHRNTEQGCTSCKTGS